MRHDTLPAPSLRFAAGSSAQRSRWVQERPQSPSSGAMFSRYDAQAAVSSRVLTWSLGGDDGQGLVPALDRFLAAQELGSQHKLDVLIFQDVPADALVPMIRGVRAPYQCVSINTEYERLCRPHASPDHRGYLLLYDATRWRVSRWPEFYRPSVFYASDAFLRPPLSVWLEPAPGHHEQPLSLYAWRMEAVDGDHARDQAQRLIAQLPAMEHERSLITATTPVWPITEALVACGFDVGQPAERVAAWTRGARLLRASLPGLSALESPQGQLPALFELR